MENQQQTLSKQFEQKTTSQLLELLKAKSSIDRYHAIRALANRIPFDESLIDPIVTTIINPQNKEAKLLGFISVSFAGIAELLQVENLKVQEVVQQLIAEWPEPDRSILIGWLYRENK